MAPGLHVLAGVEAFHVHAGADHGEALAGDAVALHDGARLRVGDGDDKVGAGRGELLAGDAALGLGRLPGLERRGALGRRDRVEGLQVGEIELPREGQGGDAAEPVVGVDEGVLAAREVRPQLLAEGPDHRVHVALGDGGGGPGVEVQQAHPLGDLDHGRCVGVGASGEEVDAMAQPGEGEGLLEHHDVHAARVRASGLGER